MNFKFAITIFTLSTLIVCKRNTVEIVNEKYGKLKSSVQLLVSGEKKFGLDTYSAPRPEYTQMYRGSDKILYFTFFNNFNNAIYFYDYKLNKFIKKIVWDNKISKKFEGITAYHIKSLDSIYLFNQRTFEIILADKKGDIISKTPLLDNMADIRWIYKYPQYYLRTVTPFIETNNELLLTGMYTTSIPETAISDFQFTASLNFKTNKLTYFNKYPPELYGFNYTWDGGLFTEVFSELNAVGNKLIFSFPVTHNLYIADLNNKQGYKQVYGGSNFAGTIKSSSLPIGKSSREEILNNIIEQDEYTAIKYDKFRKVYYRFLFKKMTAKNKKNDWHNKPIAVIVLDNQFQYLGETVIGTGEEWNWQNSFVTKEGLNIEYTGINDDENILTLKILTLKKI